MANNTYNTIEEGSEGIFKDRGSKFIAYAWPVKTEEQIRDKLEAVRKKHHNARHHCFAWRLGAEKEHYRFNDDGEPSGSAGRPVLGQIRKFDLTNILIVVVRYFGGTLLGVGGLIKAYRSAAADAIENATIAERTVDHVYEVRFGYPAMNHVMNIIREEGAEQLEQDFGADCRMVLAVRRDRSESFTGKLKKSTSVAYVKYLKTV